MFFSKGIYDGELSFYYPNGQVSRIENYSMGKQNGLFSYFLPNGELWRDILFRKDKICSIHHYFKNQNIEKILFYKNGKTKYHFLRDKFTSYYYRNGNLKSMEPFQNGKRNGESIHYYRYGEIQSRFNYKKWYLSWT